MATVQNLDFISGVFDVAVKDEFFAQLSIFFSGPRFNCRESIECFRGIVFVFAYKFCGSNDFRYDRPLYFNIFLDSFCIPFLSDGVVASVTKQID